VKRGLELGYRVESFFLQQPGMSDAKLDRILQARGITGIIFAPPYHGNRELNLSWEKYTAVGVGFGWKAQELNRVVYDSAQSYVQAFHALRKLGYQRVGTILAHELVHGHRHGTKWFAGYLECKSDFPENLEIPLFTGSITHSGKMLTDEEIDTLGLECLEWFYEWRPDALVVIYTQHVIKWFHDAGLEFPRDAGLACLVQSPSSGIAGIDEKSEVVGATALEMVASQIAHNERGLPEHPKTMMIEGCWVDGPTVQDRR
jgi:LacI family transcriptional regulator